MSDHYPQMPLPSASDVEYAVEFVRRELLNQEQKWGLDRVLPTRTWITIAAEEFGEIARADLERDSDGYVLELAQLAAVCISAIHSHTLAMQQGGYADDR